MWVDRIGSSSTMKNSFLNRTALLDRAPVPAARRAQHGTPRSDAGSFSPVPLAAPSADEVLLGLRRHEFVAYYQPKLSLLDGRLAGAEVLARWDHPEAGILAPEHFLPVMCQAGLVHMLFAQLFEQGLQLQQILAELSVTMELAFNLEPQQLSSPGFSKGVSDLLREYRCPAEGIMFELTETGSIHLPAVSLKNLLQLRVLGCGLSMDDYGRGFSSLERLCDLPFNQIKLDASFVRKLDSHPTCRSVVESTVRLAATLGLSLVVEGVETPAQMKQLKALGCPVVQGFAIGRPMPEQHLINYCLHNARSRRSIASA
ncbi:EAL domain, c-di-GMP-specific phosphodiesterase class I (or its enzymatically inactive variant) [Pseudomonas sp. NFPP19]|nr:EAL domain, c-di-GMP-specific phosphodiesterase class I (or its enzymatically inactive variant) [Pseudomonas sp. NFPP19]